MVTFLLKNLLHIICLIDMYIMFKKMNQLPISVLLKVFCVMPGLCMAINLQMAT
jgi:hypothetical protein